MRSNNTLQPNPYSTLSTQSNKPIVIGQSSNYMQNQNNPLISGSYNKMIGGGSNAISGLSSMLGGRVPSPLEFAAQKQAGQMGYSSVAQMQMERQMDRRKMLEDMRQKEYEEQQKKAEEQQKKDEEKNMLREQEEKERIRQINESRGLKIS